MASNRCHRLLVISISALLKSPSSSFRLAASGISDLPLRSFFILSAAEARLRIGFVIDRDR